MKIPLRTHRESNTCARVSWLISDSQLGLIWVDHIKRPDEVEVVAEMVALRHILRTHVINGNTYLGGQGLEIRVSCGAVKRQLLCRSKDTALYRYAAFCSVLASHASLSVWKKAWPDYMPDFDSEVSLFLEGYWQENPDSLAAGPVAKPSTGASYPAGGRVFAQALSILSHP